MVDWKKLTTVNRDMVIIKVGFFLHGFGKYLTILILKA